MTSVNFSLDLAVPQDKLLNLMTDYEQFPRYLPHQIKSVQIIEKTNDYTITEETLHLSSVISKTFVQQTKHYPFSDNLLKSEILSGPAKESEIQIKFEEISSKTLVSVNIKINLGFKYKFLVPIIKKSYKTFFTGILYKMQQHIVTSSS